MFYFWFMRKWVQKHIVYFIAVIILITLSIQAYWNIKNYEANKITVNNEVLAALNTSVDSYYTNLAKSDITSVIGGLPETDTVNISSNISIIVDSLITERLSDDTTSPKKNITESFHFIQGDSGTNKPRGMAYMIEQANFTGKSTDSVGNIATLASKIIISLSNDNIDFFSLSKYLDEELKSNGLNFKYALTLTKDFRVSSVYGNIDDPNLKLQVESRSAYLPSGSHLSMHYPNINLIALKQSSVSILLSLLFTLSIIAILLYLLKMIKQQKQIEAAKNDFISNISHELKTPIATSMSALEAIQHFNKDDDKEKTAKYMGIAGQQLHKLSSMVEKILETVSLESEQLTLHKETADIVEILKSIIEKQRINTLKTITFKTESDSLLANIDVFHFENVIDNIIENAVKYGGDVITITLLPTINQPEIIITDNGKSIDKTERARIFDKFYRIPSNNLHDIKGYGIGLYYSRSIIEKHGGRLTLEDHPSETAFKITVPYV